MGESSSHSSKRHGVPRILVVMTLSCVLATLMQRLLLLSKQFCSPTLTTRSRSCSMATNHAKCHAWALTIEHDGGPPQHASKTTNRTRVVGTTPISSKSGRRYTSAIGPFNQWRPSPHAAMAKRTCGPLSQFRLDGEMSTHAAHERSAPRRNHLQRNVV